MSISNGDNVFIMMQYLLLSLFINVCALAFTCIVFTVIHTNVWMVVFCTAATAIFFILHTLELEKLLKVKDAEIQALNDTTQVKILVRTNELENEIRRLLRPPFIWKRSRNSCSSLMWLIFNEYVTGLIFLCNYDPNDYDNNSNYCNQCSTAQYIKRLHFNSICNGRIY